MSTVLQYFFKIKSYCQTNVKSDIAQLLQLSVVSSCLCISNLACTVMSSGAILRC